MTSCFVIAGDVLRRHIRHRFHEVQTELERAWPNLIVASSLSVLLQSTYELSTVSKAVSYFCNIRQKVLADALIVENATTLERILRQIEGLYDTWKHPATLCRGMWKAKKKPWPRFDVFGFYKQGKSWTAISFDSCFQNLGWSRKIFFSIEWIFLDSTLKSLVLSHCSMTIRWHMCISFLLDLWTFYGTELSPLTYGSQIKALKVTADPCETGEKELSSLQAKPVLATNVDKISVHWVWWCPIENIKTSSIFLSQCMCTNRIRNLYLTASFWKMLLRNTDNLHRWKYEKIFHAEWFIDLKIKNWRLKFLCDHGRLSFTLYGRVKCCYLKYTETRLKIFKTRTQHSRNLYFRLGTALLVDRDTKRLI